MNIFQKAYNRKLLPSICALMVFKFFGVHIVRENQILNILSGTHFKELAAAYEGCLLP